MSSGKIISGIMKILGKDEALRQMNRLMNLDGGPGSGNFGHKGRPGKVGGSGAGGGKQYRGGRSDIGYFSSRKDWLNGLRGERQHEAVRFMATAKKLHGSRMEAKKKIESLWERGYLTRQEADQRLKEAHLDKIQEDMTPEQFIMKECSDQDRDQLLGMLKESRSWDETKERLINENLSEDEKKALSYLEENRSEFGKTRQILEAKAMGIEVPYEIPDEVLYESGVKERPAPPEPAGPDYGWWKPAAERRGYHASNMEHCMAIAAGGVPSYGHRYTQEEFAEVNQNFVNAVAHGSMTPNGLSYYGIRSIQGLRDSISGQNGTTDGYKYTKEVYDRLTDDEKNRLLAICNYARGNRFMDFYQNVYEINSSDYALIETSLRNGTPRSNKDKQIYRDYILMQEKMLTGVEPVSSETLAAEKAAKASEAKAKASVGKIAREKEFAEQQKAFSSGDGGKRKTEMKAKVKAFDPKTVLNAKNPQEIEDAFNSGGFFQDGFGCEAHGSIPNAVYADAASAYKRVMDRFPFLAGELGGFGGATSANGSCSKEAYQSGQTEIRINPVDFKNLDEENRQRDLSVRRKWHPPIDEGISAAESTVTHELGHSLANWLHRVTIGKFAVSKSTNRSLHYDNEVANELKEKTLKALGIKPGNSAETYNAIKEGLSEYGAASIKNRGRDQVKTGTSSDEFFAEAFLEGMLSSNPRPMAKEFMRQLDLFIQEHNITEDTTALVPTAMPHLMDEGEERY